MRDSYGMAGPRSQSTGVTAACAVQVHSHVSIELTEDSVR
jgi:hypothetical protein